MKKSISVTAILLITGYSLFYPVFAGGQEAPPPPPPPPPPAQEAPAAPTAPPPPPPPESAPAPTTPAIPTNPPEIPNLTETPEISTPPEPTSTPIGTESTPTPTTADSKSIVPTPRPSETPQAITENSSINNRSQPMSEGTAPTQTLPTSPSANNGQTGNVQVKSGDSNVSGTAISAANTNLANLVISEFSVVDEQQGNLVIDPASGCLSGCENFINKKRADTYALKTNFNQDNNVTIGNELNLAANSGDNSASYNTGGNSTIRTGNANVSANSLTFANNNLLGKVIYQVVDIYGELRGDVVLPQEAYSMIDENGASTNNQVTSTNDIISNITQDNEANINNEITTDANTGDNLTAYNTDGDSSVTTGTANTQVKTLNVANNNIGPGDWWIVIVNKAGEWIGEVVGGKNSNLDNLSQAGETTTVSDNGSNSINEAVRTESQDNSLSQENKATIGNKLNLSANSGRNSASYNTGGDSNIKTGNANIVANVANFVNNNVAKGGKLIVTVVNVFGKWLGNFVPPGQSSNNSAQNTNKEKLSLADALPTQTKSPTPTATAQAKIINNYTYVNSTTAPTTPTPGRTSNNTVLGTSVNRVTTYPTLEPTKTPDMQISSNSVLAAQSENDTTQPKKVININLAWLLFGLPIAAAAAVKQLMH